LYKDRKIEKQSSLLKIIMQLKGDREANKAIYAIKKYSKFNPSIGIKEKGKVLNPERKSKNFHVMGQVILNSNYTRNGKNVIYKEWFTESRIISAKTLTEAKEILKKKQYTHMN
jgi:hypothetical protein